MSIWDRDKLITLTEWQRNFYYHIKYIIDAWVKLHYKIDNIISDHYKGFNCIYPICRRGNSGADRRPRQLPASLRGLRTQERVGPVVSIVARIAKLIYEASGIVK